MSRECFNCGKLTNISPMFYIPLGPHDRSSKRSPSTILPAGGAILKTHPIAHDSNGYGKCANFG